MKIKKSIVIEAVNRYVDEVLNECSCDCSKKLIVDKVKKEEVEELDEQSVLAKALTNPSLVAKAKELIRKFPNRKYTLHQALILVARAGGKTGAMI